MKNFIFLFVLILAFSSCRSVRKTTVDIRHEKDSVAYTSVTTVDLDTTVIPSDTASLEAILGITEEGNLIIEEIKQDQGLDISLDYSLEKTSSGATRLKVKATSKPKEIITQNKTIETENLKESSSVIQVENTKKVKGFSPWNLAWLVPVVLIGIVIYLKRKTLLKFLPF